MVHGDLKGVRFFTASIAPVLPSLPAKVNILIDQRGHARLADFGLLSIISDPKYLLSSSSHTQGGTARWMSPERFNPERFGLKDGRPTIPSDCYALGMVIYEITTGNLPFHKHADFIVVSKVLEGERPPRGGNFTEDLWEMLERCWAPEPNDRPSIEGVLLCLETASDSSEPPSPGADEEIDVDGGGWSTDTSSSGGDSLDLSATDDRMQLPPTHFPQDYYPTHDPPGQGSPAHSVPATPGTPPYMGPGATTRWHPLEQISRGPLMGFPGNPPYTFNEMIPYTYISAAELKMRGLNEQFIAHVEEMRPHLRGFIGQHQEMRRRQVAGTSGVHPRQSSQPQVALNLSQHVNPNIRQGILSGVPGATSEPTDRINSQQSGVGGLDGLMWDMGDFDQSFLRQDPGDVNFERDFGQWFNPGGDVSFDMK